MTTKTNLGLVAWAKDKLGQPYWYGTCGYKATKSLLQQKTKQYPNHYSSSRMARYQQDIAVGAVVQDCVGLIKGYYWTRDDGTQKYGLDGRPDKGAGGMLAAAKEKGDIATMPEIPGLLVYLPGHIGVYIGDGQVIEARSFSHGVVLTRLRERKWKEWLKCPYIEYVDIHAPNSIPSSPAQPTSPSEAPIPSKQRILRYNPGEPIMTGEDVRLLQEKLSRLFFGVGAVDGAYGPKTAGAVKAFQQMQGLTVDGIVGTKTWAALAEI